MSDVALDPASEVLAHLRRLEQQGSRGLVTQLVHSLVTESGMQLVSVRDGLETGDLELLFRAAHTLQGSAAMVGAESVARMCSDLARAGRAGDIGSARAIAAQVETGFATIRSALAGWADRSKSAAPEEPLFQPNLSEVKPRRILVIDDDDGIRKITQMLVEGLGHEVESARDGLEGLEKLQLGIDLVLLDVVMPGLDGFDVCRRIRKDPRGKDVPVVMVTSLQTREHRLLAVEAGASDFIAKPVDETELRIRSASLLRMKDAQDELKLYQAHLEDICDVRTASLRKALEEMAVAQQLAYQAQLETVERLSILAEYKDKVTGNHIQRMSEYCAVVARGLRLPPAEVELILHASRMHDIGKVAVPDAILRKPASLDAAEWVVMRRHSAIGGAILDNSSSDILRAGQVIAMTHHERWDGTGYPHGIKGEDIPLWGRICAVCDVFDAVTSERPYKPKFPNEKAFKILRKGSGNHFDPRIVDVFFECLDDILVVQEKFRDPELSLSV
jgi:cyclic di-GMP phosphodiesterase